MGKSNSSEKFKEGLKRNGKKQNEASIGDIVIVQEIDGEYLNQRKYENLYTDKKRWGFPTGGVGGSGEQKMNLGKVFISIMLFKKVECVFGGEICSHRSALNFDIFLQMLKF